MVNSPGIFHPRFSWHESSAARNDEYVNRQGLTPSSFTSGIVADEQGLKFTDDLLGGLRASWPSDPELPVERPVLERLADVLGLDAFRAREVGDHAGDFQDAVVGAGAGLEALRRF
jgi:hypothetical protein